jgi:hypothetical protein
MLMRFHPSYDIQFYDARAYINTHSLRPAFHHVRSNVTNTSTLQLTQDTSRMLDRGKHICQLGQSYTPSVFVQRLTPESSSITPPFLQNFTQVGVLCVARENATGGWMTSTAPTLPTLHHEFIPGFMLVVRQGICHHEVSPILPIDLHSEAYVDLVWFVDQSPEV